MNASDIEDIYRSRKTLLDILELRGYDTNPFRNFSPEEIAAAVPGPENLPALSFNLKKKDTADKRVCYVRYGKFSRQKLVNTFESAPNSTVGETIVLTMDPVLDVHHQLALKLYFTKPEPILVSFFWISHIVNNPLNHILVPKHEIVPEEEVQPIMDKFNMIAKSKFPLIRFHVDPIIRLLGGVPGDLVKITRPSPSAGIYEFYRLVSP
jgi:DNA-directed RNA polymerase subunit H (RpoH/RPB5)